MTAGPARAASPVLAAVSGALALAAAVLATVSLVVSPFPLWPGLLAPAGLVAAGVLVLVRRPLGLAFVVGFSAWTLPGAFNKLVFTLYYDTKVSSAWWLARSANLLTLGAAVVAAVALIKISEPRFSRLSAVVLPVGLFLSLLYVVGMILPAGQYTVNGTGPSNIGELFYGPAVAHFAPAMWIAAALLLPLLAAFFERLGGPLLAGWAAAALLGGVGEAVALLRTESVGGNLYDGTVGAGSVIRIAAAVLLGAFAVVLMARRGDAPAPPEAVTAELIPVGALT
jgi:hypothetical protein